MLLGSNGSYSSSVSFCSSGGHVRPHLSHVSVRYRRIIPVRDPTSISAPVREKLLTPKEISTQEKVAALRLAKITVLGVNNS